MAVINYASREILCKIVYYGPALGGKTTNLQMIHSMAARESRGELVSLTTDQDRTLYFDFLPLDLGEIRGLKTKFQLYTVPGQVYYNATRKLVLRGVDALVFVVDSSRARLDDNKESLQNLRENLIEHGIDPDQLPWVVQYNKRDLPDAMPVEELDRELGLKSADRMEAVASAGQGVKETLKRISTIVISRMRTSENAENTGPLKTVAPTPSVEEPVELMRGPSVCSVPEVKLPRIAVKQRSAIFWRGWRIGTASLEARSRMNADGNGEYQLTTASRILFFPERVSVEMLDFKGEHRHPLADDRPGYRFSPSRNSGNGHRDRVELWIARDSSALIARFDGSRGAMEFRPLNGGNGKRV